MKKLMTFFFGIVLIGLMFAAMFLTGAIYDAAEKQTVEPYFFQVNNQSAMRPGAPQGYAELGNSTIRDMLIKKYVVEYFYANPDTEDIARRVAGQTALRRMSSRTVFDKWTDTEAETIQDIAENKGLRTVRVFDEIYKLDDNSDYWIIEYELKTWREPNNFDVLPEITRGRIFLNVIDAPGVRRDMDVGRYLESGGDPAAVFRFRVDDAIVQ